MSILQSQLLRRRYLYRVDLLFKVLNKWIKSGDVGSVITLLVFSEAKKVGDVLRPPAMEVEFIILLNQTSHLFVVGRFVACRFGGHFQ